VKLILSIVLAYSLFHYSQTDTSYIQTEEIINELVEESQEEEISSEIYDNLEDLLNNPIDINTADINELQTIPFVDFSIARKIIEHRDKYGLFFSVNELYSVRLIPADVVNKILPFVIVKPVVQREEESFFTSLKSQTDISLRSRIQNDLQERKGFSENKFKGSSTHIYNRMILKYENFQAGFLTEKDPGEEQFNEFSSGHIYVKDLALIKNLVIGDYYIEFGQGLALWNVYGLSKSSDAVYPVKKNERRIIPYKSTSENNFFRGAAVEFDYKSFSLSVFYSKNKFDANIDDASGEILSTPLNGLHRTETELKRRKSAQETVYGARLDFVKENLLRIGLLHYRSNFSHPFQPSDVYDIAGNKFNYTSAAYDLYIENINLFGEVVYNGRSVASINNIQFYLSSNLQYIISIRSYPVNFINIHGFGFGERSGAAQNEFGIYNGLKWRLPFGIFNVYYDQFKFPYATFDTPLPAVGNEFLIEFTFNPFTKVETKIRYKKERKELKFNTNNENVIAERNKESIRSEIIYDISKLLRWRTRFEYNFYAVKNFEADEDGFMFYQDIRYIPFSGLNIFGRIIFYRTDSFNTAIYQYENNLTGVLSNTALYGEGIRWYFMVRYKVFSFLTLSGRYSETYKPKERTLGSGDSEINGNLDNRINFQIDLTL